MLALYIVQYRHYTQKGIELYFPGLGYAEIIKCVILDTLKVRRDRLCKKKLFIRLKSARVDLTISYLGITNMILNKEMYTRHQ